MISFTTRPFLDIFCILSLALHVSKFRLLYVLVGGNIIANYLGLPLSIFDVERNTVSSMTLIPGQLTPRSTTTSI